MPAYWDRFAKTYGQIGEADFWLKHRLRLLDGLFGRVIEVCCGGGRLVVEMLKQGLDAYGIDLSPRMVEQAQAKLKEAGFETERISVADVTQLPFPDNDFEFVISTGSIALFRLPAQRAAMGEMARIASREVRLLEPIEKQRGLYLGRVLAFTFDGMRPIPREVFEDCRLECHAEWGIWGGTFTYLRCCKR